MIYERSQAYKASKCHSYTSVKEYVDSIVATDNYKDKWLKKYPDILYCLFFIYAIINRVYLFSKEDKANLLEDFSSNLQKIDVDFPQFCLSQDYIPFIDRDESLRHPKLSYIYETMKRRNLSFEISYEFYYDLCSFENELVNHSTESLGTLLRFLLTIYNSENITGLSENEEESLLLMLCERFRQNYINRVDYSLNYFIDNSKTIYPININNKETESIIYDLLTQNNLPNKHYDISFSRPSCVVLNCFNDKAPVESLEQFAATIDDRVELGLLLVPTSQITEGKLNRYLRNWAERRILNSVSTVATFINRHEYVHLIKNEKQSQSLIILRPHDYKIKIGFFIAEPTTSYEHNWQRIVEHASSDYEEIISPTDCYIAVQDDMFINSNCNIDPNYYQLQKFFWKDHQNNSAYFEELFSLDYISDGRHIDNARGDVFFSGSNFVQDLSHDSVHVQGPAILADRDGKMSWLKEKKIYEFTIPVNSKSAYFTGLLLRSNLYLPDYIFYLLSHPESAYLWAILNHKSFLCNEESLCRLKFSIPSIDYQWKVVSELNEDVFGKANNESIGISPTSRKALSKFEKKTLFGTADNYFKLINKLAEDSSPFSKLSNTQVCSFIKGPGELELESLFNPNEISALSKDFPYIVDYCCNAYNMDISYSSLLQHTQPAELTSFCISLLNPQPGSRVYNPFAGFGSYFVGLSNCNCVGEEISQKATYIANIRLALSGSKSRVVCSDSFESIKNALEKFNYIITTPPIVKNDTDKLFNAQYINQIISDLYNNKLNYGGKMVIVLPLAFSYDSTYKITKQLIKDCAIEKYVSLPKVFVPLSSQSYSVIVIVKNHKVKKELEESYKTLLIDGTSFYQKSVSLSTPGYFVYRELLNVISDKDKKYSRSINLKKLVTDFCPSRFFYEKPELPQGKQLVKFRDLIVSRSEKERAIDSLPCVRGKDLYDHYCSFEVKPSGHCKIGKQYSVVTQPSILLKIDNDSVKVGFVKSTPVWVENLIFPFVINNKVKPEYLLKEFLSDYVKAQMKACLVFEKRAGRNRVKDLSEVEIAIPSINEQDIELKDDAFLELERVNQKLKKQFDLYIEDTHMKKHAIGQNILNLSSYWQSLLLARDLNNGNLPDDYVLGKKHPLIVKDIISKISMYLAEVSRGIENFTYAEDPRFVEKTDILVDSFLREFIESHSNPEYEILYQPNNDATSLGIIHFSKEALKIILQNIISNAWRHGFKNRKEGNYIKIDWHETEYEVHINISNNGMPIDDSMGKDRLFEFGTSTQRGVSDMEGHTHSGLGCYQIKALMNIDNQGDVSVMSNPNTEFAVTFNLKFFK